MLADNNERHRTSRIGWLRAAVVLAVGSLLHFAIRTGHALMLPRMFGPGIHQKCFDVTVRVFKVLKNSPSVMAVTSPNTSVPMANSF
jgi:hypothetical protein